MAQTDMEVPARYYARLAGLLAQRGVDFAAILRSLKLSPEALSRPSATIRVTQVDELIARIFAASDYSDIAFDLGRLLTVSSHTFVGFGMLNCATLADALRFEARYFRLVMPSFEMRYRPGAGTAELHFLPVVAMSSLSLSFHIEAIAMAALREISDLTEGNPPDIEIELSISEPPHVERYRDLRGVVFRFGAESVPGLRVHLLGNPARYTLAIADATALRLAEQRCQSLIQRTTRERRFADWVAMTLREVSGAVPALDEIAELLNISRRTLNRHLEREGTSYRDIAKRIKHELACERLTKGGMSVSQVAYSLGFSDPSNFARAFRSQAGCSPGQYAARGNARPASLQ